MNKRENFKKMWKLTTYNFVINTFYKTLKKEEG